MEDPKFFDEFPIKQDITVLEADNGKNLIKFCVYEYCGFEIYKYTEEMEKLYKDGKISLQQLLDDRQFPVNILGNLKYHKIITVKEELKIGDKVICKGNLNDNIYNIGVVCGEKEPRYISFGDECRLRLIIEFGKDIRKCWIGCGLVNMNALEKVSFGEQRENNI